MSRRSSLGSFIAAAARAARHAEAAQRRELAARQRQDRIRAQQILKNNKEREKQDKLDYLEMRVNGALELSNESNDLFSYLKSGIIQEALKAKTINFDTLKPAYNPPKFTKVEIIAGRNMPSEREYISRLGEPPIWASFFSSAKKKWLVKVQGAQAAFKRDFELWQMQEKENNRLHEKRKADFEESEKQYEEEYKIKCEEIFEFRKLYLALDQDAICEFTNMVLEKSNYLIDWDRDFKVAYASDSKEVLVEFGLPNFDVVPAVAEYKYVKSKDEIDEKNRKVSDMELCYKYLISGIAIRTIYEVIQSAQTDCISQITFNGYIDSIDRSTGKEVRPMIISVSTTKSEFETLSLSKVDPIKCVQSLSAVVSSSPNELVAIKPIRDFNMVDKRFVKEEDIASTLDTRPNLMDLNPYEFENLVSNLFSKMGLETKQTRSHKDGGVDAIAFDIRPILGGKVVIQAKRYKDTVGVSAVRDLYGTMMNEGASKGILVCTSSYGPDAFHFSKDKPIELIDGAGLLYFLNQVGVKAKIIMPA